MRIDFDRYRRELLTDGVTLLPADIFPASYAQDWQGQLFSVVDEGRAKRVYPSATPQIGRTGRPAGCCWTAPGRDLGAHYMGEFYEALAPLVSALSGEEVITPRDPLDEIVAVACMETGDATSWQPVSGGITAVLHLTDNPDGCTECEFVQTQPGAEPQRRVFRPEAGSVLVIRPDCARFRLIPVTSCTKAVAVWRS